MVAQGPGTSCPAHEERLGPVLNAARELYMSIWELIVKAGMPITSALLSVSSVETRFWPGDEGIPH